MIAGIMVIFVWWFLVIDSQNLVTYYIYRDLPSCQRAQEKKAAGVSEDSITSCYEVIDEIRTYSHPSS